MGKQSKRQREAKLPYTGRDLKKRDLETEETQRLRKEQAEFNRDRGQELGRMFGNVKPAKTVRSRPAVETRRSRRR